MQMIFALYPINMNICKRKWMVCGRNLRKMDLKLINGREESVVK